MTALNSFLVLAFAFLAVFGQAVFPGVRHLLGAQVDQRELILHKLSFAQIVLGAVACAVVPAMTVLLLLTGGAQPLLGWGSLWQWLVMTAGGAVATPVIFALFAWCHHALGYQPRTETSFRPDREIHRGRK